MPVSWVRSLYLTHSAITASSGCETCPCEHANVTIPLISIQLLSAEANKSANIILTYWSVSVLSSQVCRHSLEAKMCCFVTYQVRDHITSTQEVMLTLNVIIGPVQCETEYYTI